MQRTQVLGAPMKVQFQPRRVASCAMRVQCNALGNQPSQPWNSNPIIRLAATASSMINNTMNRMKAAAAESTKNVDEAQLNQQIKDSVKNMRMLALIAPFAAVSGSADTFYIITKAVASFIKLYLLLLFVRVLLSWFPTFTWWEQQPWLALRQVTDPYLKLFSGLVPPLLGTIDLTPLFGFFILQFLAGALDVADDETRFWS
jgi:YggT family protein